LHEINELITRKKLVRLQPTLSWSECKKNGEEVETLAPTIERAS
jgi:hypothetical protein